MFARALGNIQPKEVDSELFDLTYVKCNEPSVDATLERDIENFCRWLEKYHACKGQICLAFYDKSAKKFLLGTDKVYWEKWLINIVVRREDNLDPADRARKVANLEAKLRAAVSQILHTVVEKKEHIPLRSITEAVPFPYEITIPTSTESW
eukprot:CAMPEP_0196659498 /NCGR_PEP_ID=MMETSP1086-20130531/35318_1 /TAXON_ID=77921 /ORGANISM="Cyanoptyche  gloeocystis , Strain SAG4.97" /LENGTH=150 /DNA_ID=CAMNT_0041993511 /DNA_START=121 /DNA_END=570 /DNA_ORIENTATION=-